MSGGIPAGMNPIAIGNGGTNATTAPQALRNLGAIGVDSPAFTGTPTAPTAPPGTSTTQLATTAFVTTADALLAPLASPTFTGTVTAPGLTLSTTPLAVASGGTGAATAPAALANLGGISGNQPITLSGDVTGGPAATAITALLNTVNASPGSTAHASLTTNAKGLVTANSVGNHTGDVTSAGLVTTLATVNSNIGTFAACTVNGKGLVTAATPLSGYGTTAAGVLTVNRVQGVTNGSNAVAGDVGEYLSSIVLSTSPVSLAVSNTTYAITTLALSAGDWNIWGEIWFSGNGATITTAGGAINTSLALPGDASDTSAFTNLTWNGTPSYPVILVGMVRSNASGIVTYTLIARVSFAAGGPPTGWGIIRARRVR